MTIRFGQILLDTPSIRKLDAPNFLVNYAIKKAEQLKNNPGRVAPLVQDIEEAGYDILLRGTLTPVAYNGQAPSVSYELQNRQTGQWVKTGRADNRIFMDLLYFSNYKLSELIHRAAVDVYCLMPDYLAKRFKNPESPLFQRLVNHLKEDGTDWLDLLRENPSVP